METIILPQSCNAGDLSYQSKRVYSFISVKHLQILLLTLFFENDTWFFFFLIIAEDHVPYRKFEKYKENKIALPRNNYH